MSTSDPPPEGGRPRRKPGPKPGQFRVRDVVSPIRSNAEWKAAVVAFADWDRAPSFVDLIDRAVAAYARERDYPVPIPKR